MVSDPSEATRLLPENTGNTAYGDDGQVPGPSSPHELQRINPSQLRIIKGNLYISHFLSTWNARLFEYAAVLFLAEIFPGDFIPLSLYAMLRTIAVILFSHLAGAYVDKTARLRVLRESIVYQRLAVIVSCVLFFFLLKRVERNSANALFQGGLLAVVILMACVERLCSVINLLAVERDWVVVLAEGDSERLRGFNSQMRRIDLFCKLVGPLAISFLDGFVDTEICIYTVLGLNFVSIFIEYYSIAKVYHSSPLLASSRKHQVITDDEDPAEVFDESDSQPAEQQTEGQSWVKRSFKSVTNPIVFYYSHDLFSASFSLSMVYFTVLSFGPTMVAYLLFRGAGTAPVGVARGVSVLFELSATLIAPWLMRWIGPIRSGLWFINWQALFTCAAATAVHLSHDTVDNIYYTWQIYLFVFAVILSRIGLWGFDLSIQIQVQEGVDESHRARFSAIESAVQSFFELLSYISTIIWSRPHQFEFPSFLTAIAVVGAALTYARYVHFIRKHLFHFNRVISGDYLRFARWRQEDTDI